MSSTPPPPVVGRVGNLTVFLTARPAASPPSPGPESPRDEFSTPPTTPRAAEEPPASPETPERPAAPPPLEPPGTLSTPPLVRTVSPELPTEKPTQPPPVQVPPPQYEKTPARTDGSTSTFFWDVVARVQEAHASLDEYISNWFGLDQSKYQWALNDYFERSEQEMGSGNAGKMKELSSSKM